MNDAERLRHDPAMRWIVGGQAAQGRAASPSQMGRFETQWLAAPANLSALSDLSGQWIDIVHGRRPPKGIVLDMDSSVSPTHGEQEDSVWNGHYACTCYHPLFVFNQFGDLERCTLRPGNVHSADGWVSVLMPGIVRYQGKAVRIYFRADAAFAMPGVYECLEAERIRYAIRLPANQVLQNRIGYLLKRPVGRPPNEVRRYYANFTYRAASWSKPRRVIAISVAQCLQPGSCLPSEQAIGFGTQAASGARSAIRVQVAHPTQATPPPPGPYRARPGRRRGVRWERGTASTKRNRAQSRGRTRRRRGRRRVRRRSRP